MQKSLITVVILFIIALSAHGQNPPAKKVISCKGYEVYIPYHPEYMPIKRVRLVLHFFQKEDGGGNLQNIPAHRYFIQSIINHLNAQYQTSDTMKPYPESKGISFVGDKRIRFVVDTILFHRDSDAWNFKAATVTYAEGKRGSYFNEMHANARGEWMYEKYVMNNASLPAREKDSAINIFFVDIPGFDGRGMTAGIPSKRWIYYVGAYDFYKKDSLHPDHWEPAMTLAHELGHALGLGHPYDDHECTDLPNTSKGATNNLMDSWPKAGNAITSCQIGTMHYNLSGYDGDIGDAVIRDWCVYHPDSAMHITKDTVVFDGARYLWGDLFIDGSATLIVKCTLSMPPTSHIYIKKGGALIVDEGTITNICGEKWGGIKMQKTRLLFFKRSKNKPLFNIINNGQVLEAATEPETNWIVKQ